MGVRLPAEYQEVEYLRSTGGQIIAVRNVGRTEFDVSITTDVYWENVTKRQLHGADTRRYFGVVNGHYQVNQTGTSTTDLVAVINQWQHVVFSRIGSVCTLKVDSDEREVTIAASASAPTGFCLFGIGQSNSYNCLCRLKRTLVEIEDDHYDFIPCYRKLDSKPGMYDLVSGEFFTNAGTGEFVLGPDVIDSISPWLVAWRRIMMAAESVAKKLTKLIATSTTGLVSFNTNVEMPTKVTCEFSPVQEGSGDPSPDNVRPISGWTGCNITQAGKNLYNANALRYGYYTANGNYNVDNNLRSTQLIKVTGSNIAISWGTVVGSLVYLRISFFDKDKVFIERHSHDNSPLSSNGYRIETCPSGTEYIVISFEHSQNNYVNNDKFQIELGSTVTTYEAYHVTSFPITFTDPSTGDPLTVYGGTVTLNEDGSVVLNKNYELQRFTGWNDTYHRIYSPTADLDYADPRSSGVSVNLYGDYVRLTFALNKNGPYAQYDRDSSRYKVYACNIAPHLSSYNNQSVHWYRSSYLNIVLPISLAGNTKESVINYLHQLALDGNPLTLLIPFITPREYTFSDIGQLQSFLGTNNIWHDINGDITVEYWNKQ